MVGGNFWAQIQKYGGLGDSSSVSLRMLFEEFPVSRCSHLESGALFPLSLYLAAFVPGVWVLLMSMKI